MDHFAALGWNEAKDQKKQSDLIIFLLSTTFSACVGQGTIHDAFLIAEKNNRGEEDGEQPPKKWLKSVVILIWVNTAFDGYSLCRPVKAQEQIVDPVEAEEEVGRC